MSRFARPPARARVGDYLDYSCLYRVHQGTPKRSQLVIPRRIVLAEGWNCEIVDSRVGCQGTHCEEVSR